MNYEGLYLVKEREFVRFNEDIYKLGKSQNVLDRIKNYPKDSMLHLLIFCKDSDILEKELIKILTKKFKLASKYGAEYFEGKLDKMILEIESFMKTKNCIFCITNNIITHKVNTKVINDENTIKTIYPINDDNESKKSDNKNDNKNENISNNKIDNKNENIVHLLNNYKGKRILHKCNLCNFTTSKKASYDIHLQTTKIIYLATIGILQYILKLFILIHNY
jgi:hypothetical protein